MRNRKDIIAEISDDIKKRSHHDPWTKAFRHGSTLVGLMLEVLLDIRDLLDNKPPATHPVSPPPPEVKP